MPRRRPSPSRRTGFPARERRMRCCAPRPARMIHGRKLFDGRISRVPLFRAIAFALVICGVVSAQTFSDERPIAAQRFNDPIRIVIGAYAVAANQEGGYAAWSE